MEFKGSGDKYYSWKRKVNREYKTVKITFEHWYEGPDYNDFCHIVCECIPYNAEELEEMMMYGNYEHDDYIMSDSYREDCRNEQWEWLNNA